MDSTIPWPEIRGLGHFGAMAKLAGDGELQISTPMMRILQTTAQSVLAPALCDLLVQRLETPMIDGSRGRVSLAVIDDLLVFLSWGHRLMWRLSEGMRYKASPAGIAPLIVGFVTALIAMGLAMAMVMVRAPVATIPTKAPPAIGDILVINGSFEQSETGVRAELVEGGRLQLIFSGSSAYPGDIYRSEFSYRIIGSDETVVRAYMMRHCDSHNGQEYEEIDLYPARSVEYAGLEHTFESYFGCLRLSFVLTQSDAATVLINNPRLIRVDSE